MKLNKNNLPSKDKPRHKFPKQPKRARESQVIPVPKKGKKHRSTSDGMMGR